MISFMAWNSAAYAMLGPDDESAEARADLTELEHATGAPLPEAVREWYLLGGDRRLAAISSNLVTQTPDFKGQTINRFLPSGFLLLETDSQHCCRWVVATSTTNDDPPVYLIDPDDDACMTRTRYANTFSDYAFTCAWDAELWNGELLTDFDHPLPLGALDTLKARLTMLPTTYGWAMNQSCDAVYRFNGPALIALAVSGTTALWSAIAASSPVTREAFVRLIGAAPEC